MEERSIDRLARYIITLGILGIVAVLCWYFRSVLVYIIAAFVVSLIGRPVMRRLRRVRIKGRPAPDWLLSILTIVFIMLVLGLIITQAVPVVVRIVKDAAIFNNRGLSGAAPLEALNQWLIGLFPSLGPDFNAVGLLINKMREALNVSNVTSILGSVASAVSGTAIGIFSVVFISFFFIKDEFLFGRIVGALVPDRIEPSVGKTIHEIDFLLSRYFVGLTIEVLGVALVDFLGLWAIARLPFTYAVGIAFIAGILNVIPYVGPLIGEVIGVVLGVIIKYGTGAGLDVNLWIFALVVFAVMMGAQLIDNFIYQPLIYSTSIKASPLEIFIVLLVAGHVGGMLGMLVAIPAYTVIRVIASRFFYHLKPVRRLMPDRTEEDQWLES